MGRRNKRTRHCLSAIKKWWKKKLQLETDVLDSEYDKTNFDTWLDDKSEPVNNNQFVEELRRVNPNVFEELVKNAKQPDMWKTKGRKRYYTGSAKSTLCNKRAAWRKAALGSKKITTWFTNEISTDCIDSSSYNEKNNNYELLFDEAGNSSDIDNELPFDEAGNLSDDDDDNLTLAFLDALLKKGPIISDFVQWTNFFISFKTTDIQSFQPVSFWLVLLIKVHGMHELSVHGQINS